MADEWRKVKLGDVVAINPDAIGPDWPFPHINYVDISSVGEGIAIEPPRLMSLAEAPSRAKRPVRKGDTILSTVRPNRRSMFFVSEHEPDLVVSTGFAVLRPKPEMIHPRYLYACVFDKDFTDYLVSREKGAAYPAVLPEDIADATINLPPLPEQRAIAHILGTLDDKIELNRRMSETLEQMARAIFKAWFIDFEPVRAKMEGRWQRGQSLPGLPAHLYDLFPDRLVASELGKIPEGWEVRRVDDLCSRVENGGTPKRMVPTYWGGSVPWFKTGELTDGPLLVSEETITKEGLSSSSCKLWPIGTILIALYASPTVGRLGILEVPGTANQACSALLAKPEFGNLFLFYTLLSTRDRLQQIAVGAAQQNISQQDVRDHRVIAPLAAIARAFHDLVGPLHQRRVNLIRESRTLAALRDALLPKLIRGEIRVKDAERFLKERGL